MNPYLVIPFLTSLGALIYELAVAQFLGMALGNATFAFSFAVGVFLLSMGFGSYQASRFPQKINAAHRLLWIELVLALLCFVSLPILVEATSFFRFYTLGVSTCRSLICSNAGIGLLTVSTVFLFAVGAAVGMEMPLFFRLLKVDQAQILAADYVGAFAAGLLFPLFLLPVFGLWGALSLGAFFHWLVSVWAGLRLGQRKKSTRWAVWILKTLIALAIFLQLFFSAAGEKFLMTRLTAYLVPAQVEVLESFRTRKQSVLLSRAQLNGHEDLRLYLDGYLQFSSQWNTQAYHEAMALPARQQLGSVTEAKQILVLGGGDGLLAETIVDHYPNDQVRVVDFDCGLVKAFAARPNLRALSPHAWSSPNVHFMCEDAFFYIQQPTEFQKWDLVLVDFPHGVGDAASLRVETWEFFRDLRKLLKPDSGRVVLHHEEYNSEERVCVEGTLKAAGFETSSFPVEEGAGSEAMIIGHLHDYDESQVDASAIQTVFRPRCTSGIKRFGKIWLGS